MTIPDIALASGIGHALASWLTLEGVMLQIVTENANAIRQTAFSLPA
jgi:hypothetical protein